jgi:hypothetical protein
MESIIAASRPAVAIVSAARTVPALILSAVKAALVSCLRPSNQRSGVRRQAWLRLLGTTPPLSASFVITCWCSQMFISAEPLSSPL